jgi:hypothetical protein
MTIECFACAETARQIWNGHTKTNLLDVKDFEAFLWVSLSERLGIF